MKSHMSHTLVGCSFPEPSKKTSTHSIVLGDWYNRMISNIMLESSTNEESLLNPQIRNAVTILRSRKRNNYCANDQVKERAPILAGE